MDIKNKVIIVTGASQGIGEAAAKELAGRGAKVVLAARSKDKINKLAKTLPDALAVPTDMRKPADIKKLVQKTVQKFGRVDILINNAGQGMFGPLEKSKLADYKKMMDLNVFGVFLAMQAVIPVMRQQGGGMILNVSSGVSKAYYPNLSTYSSTKYAVNALTLIARQELKKDKIVVSALHPNMTASNFYQNAIGKMPDFSGRQMPPMDPSEKVAQRIVQLIKSEAAELEV